MKKYAKLFSLLLVLLLMMNLSISAFADGSISYDGNAKKFIFAPGTSHSPTNLFDSFQNMMPGDVCTEQILIKNDKSNNVKIKVYIRSLGAQEDTDTFLSQLNLTVQQNEDSILFDAPADQTAQLKDWVYLGTVYSGGEIILDVTLEVPITMGNEFQNNTGYIDWEFKIEELSVESTDPQPPQTGDTFNLYVNMLIISLVGLTVLLVICKQKHCART